MSDDTIRKIQIAIGLGMFFFAIIMILVIASQMFSINREYPSVDTSSAVPTESRSIDDVVAEKSQDLITAVVGGDYEFECGGTQKVTLAIEKSRSNTDTEDSYTYYIYGENNLYLGEITSKYQKDASGKTVGSSVICPTSDPTPLP